MYICMYYVCMYAYVVLCDSKKAGAVREKCGEGNFCLGGELS